jgi:hypothetical protein
MSTPGSSHRVASESPEAALENVGCFGGQTIANDADAPMWGKAISKTRKRDSDSSHG